MTKNTNAQNYVGFLRTTDAQLSLEDGRVDVDEVMAFLNTALGKLSLGKCSHATHLTCVSTSNGRTPAKSPISCLIFHTAFKVSFQKIKALVGEYR